MASAGFCWLHRHRHGHAQIGDHLAVVGKGIGDDAVQQAKEHHQHLSHGVSLGVEDKRRDAYQRGGQRQIILPVKGAEGSDDKRRRQAPQEPLGSGKVSKQLSPHKIHLQKNSTRIHIF